MAQKIIIVMMWCLLLAGTTFAFDRQDTLRGSNGNGRNWWDVQHYSLVVSLDTAHKSIRGVNTINAKITATPNDSMQIDLQELMFLDSVVLNGKQLEVAKEGNVWWIIHPFHLLALNANFEVSIYYHGKPREAVNPPWDGGFIWTKDSIGSPWIAVACQGLGASSWWPCKDYQEDEPDSGMLLSLVCNEGLSVIMNGDKIGIVDLPHKENEEKFQLAQFKVKNPINTYNATFYIGNYVHWEDTLMGEKGKLKLSFFALKYNENRARQQFAVTKSMLHCFEYWMGPYPFYEDGYKLVEAPYLGMEHQSAVAYGNKYKMGYLGSDRSKTGVGLLFDFIIVHETGHEWFGNNITAKDIADNWLHEGFTTYTEALFAECAFGKEKAVQYTIGEWDNIKNATPIIGQYGVQNKGGDIYDKGAAVVHMIRIVMNDDEKFRQLLRGLNKDFYHKTVSSAEVELYISNFAGYDYTTFFNQYLRTTQVPKLDWYIKGKQLHYRYADAIDGFAMPLIITKKGKKIIINPTKEWQNIRWKGALPEQPKNYLLR